MKLLLLLIALSLFSCSSSTIPTPGTGSSDVFVQIKLNGNLVYESNKDVNWTNSNVEQNNFYMSYNTSSISRQSANFSKNTATLFSISMPNMGVPSVRSWTFNRDNFLICSINSVNYGTMWLHDTTGHYFNITEVNGNRINGNFSCKVYNTSTGGNAAYAGVLTGTFKNLFIYRN